MSTRQHLSTVSGTIALALLMSSATHPAFGRLPWAATSELHFVDAVVAAANYRAEAGGLAMKKSPSSDVREFGRTLWVDSIENTRRLKWVLTDGERDVVLPTQ